MRTNINRIACLALLLTLTVQGLGRLANAQAPVSAPTLTFLTADGTMLHKADNPFFPVRAAVSDAAGIQSVSLSSPVGSGCGQFNGAKSGSIGVTFFAGYYPVGDYVFTARATNVNGLKTSKSITIHLVN